MGVDNVRYLLVLLSTVTSLLLGLLLWNVKTFLTTFTAHLEQENKFAMGMVSLTATMIETTKQIDQRLQRIENKLWN